MNQCVPISGETGVRYIQVRDRVGVQRIGCRERLGQPGRKHRYPDRNFGGPRNLSFDRQQSYPALQELEDHSLPAKLGASPN